MIQKPAVELCHRLFRQTLLYPVLKGIFPGVVGEVLLKGGAEAPWEGERKGTLQTVFVAALDVEQLFCCASVSSFGRAVSPSV